ncbi:MAG: hypothetical protein F6K52_18295 [Moorea sp. SIO3H5]|nr:hypothetical protein [Moorena sp. SIO3H5]
MMNKAMLARSWLRERKFQGNKLSSSLSSPENLAILELEGLNVNDKSV